MCDKVTTITQDPDSIEVKAKTGGSGFKVYGDFSKPKEFEEKIESAKILVKIAEQDVL